MLEAVEHPTVPQNFESKECGTGGKLSTWFSPGGLVEQSFFLLFVLLFCFFFVSLLSPIIFLFWLLLSFLSALLSFFTSILLCVLYMLNLAYHHFLFRLQIIFSKFRFSTFNFRFWWANKLWITCRNFDFRPLIFIWHCSSLI